MIDCAAARGGWLMVAGVCLMLSACGKAADPGYRPVRGTVSLDGQPLVDAIVSFQPEGEGSSGTGRTDESGRYTLYYASQRPGAKAGMNRVMISKELPAAAGRDEFSSSSEEEGELLPARYNLKTELTASVTDGENVIDFALTSD